MINESQLKRIIKKIILQEMPQRNYKQLPTLGPEYAAEKGLEPVSLRKGKVYKERSPLEFEKLLNNPKTDAVGYEKSLARSFANLDINVDVLVQPIDNSLMLYFDDMYTEFAGADPSSDRILIIPPEDYFDYISPNSGRSEIGYQFPHYFKSLHNVITNWTKGKLNDGNSCLFVILGDSIKNQKSIYPESKNKVQWFAKTPWVLTHTLFHQVSTVSHYYPEYEAAYTEYDDLCQEYFPTANYQDLYPWLTFTTGIKRNALDHKITKEDLPNELLVSFLRIIKYTGKTDTRNDLEIATKFFIPGTPIELINQVANLVPYMKNVINEMFDLWRGKIVFSITENPDYINV